MLGGSPGFGFTLYSVSYTHLDVYKRQEKSQAVDGIESSEILEIIDHHRLGTIEKMCIRDSTYCNWNLSGILEKSAALYDGVYLICFIFRHTSPYQES